MSVKISKISGNKFANCNIHPVLYRYYLRLRDTLGAQIIHRRKRTSATCIEIFFYDEFSQFLSGRVNTLPEAEECGFWIICRPQKKKNRPVFYHGHRVYQLFITPVHPKKRRETQPVIRSLDSSVIVRTALEA